MSNKTDTRITFGQLVGLCDPKGEGAVCIRLLHQDEDKDGGGIWGCSNSPLWAIYNSYPVQGCFLDDVDDGPTLCVIISDAADAGD